MSTKPDRARKRLKTASDGPPQQPNPSTSEQVSTKATDINVDPQGDIILAVGADAGMKFNLKVSSKILSLTSDMFAALLSPHFSEGQQKPDVLSPPRIRLPEDDAQAMLDLCNITHLRLQQVGIASGRSIVNLAVLCNKYLCADRTPIWFASPIRSQLSLAVPGITRGNLTKAGLSLMELVSISYIFDDEAIFWKATASAAVRLAWEGQDDREDTTITDVIDLKLLELITKQSQRSAPTVTATLEKSITDILGKQCLRKQVIEIPKLRPTGQNRSGRFLCRAASDLVAYLVLSYNELSPWPSSARDNPLSMPMLQDFLCRVIKNLPKDKECGKLQCATSRLPKFEKKLAELMSDTEKSIRGACLRCVKSGNYEPIEPGEFCKTHPLP